MSLRIMSPAAPETARALAAESSTTVDQYMDRLVKLVPAEAIAAYPLLAKLASEEGAWALILVSWLLLAMSIILRRHATASGDSGPQRTAVIVAAVSFIIWVYVMNGTFGITLLINSIGLDSIGAALLSAKSFLSVVLLVIWTMLVPVFYQGDTN
jgi:hypothetical protein